MASSVFHGRFEITGCYLQNWGHWAPPAAPHRGLDLVGIDDTHIFAPVSGTVLHAGDGGDGFGIYVEILGVDGRKYFLAHMSSCCAVTGRKVKEGDTIGVMGATGNVTGPHTHFEIREPDGSICSPADYLGIPNVQGIYSSTQIGKPPLTVIDVTDGKIVGGWALNANGVDRVDIYVDNNIGLGSVHKLFARPDVARVHPSYPGAGRCGYRLAVKIAPGKHVIKVAAVGMDGSVRWAVKNIDV